MAICLQLENHDIYHYRTWYSRTEYESGPTTYHTKCGIFWNKKPSSDDGCNHIECAIEAAEFMVSHFKLWIYMGVATLVLSFIMYVIGTSMDAALLVMTYSILCIIYPGYFFWVHDKERRELVEFKYQGTVNGIRAKQI